MARVVIACMFAIVLTGILASAWFVLQPAVVGIAVQIDENLVNRGQNNTDTDNIITLTTLSMNVFIALIVIGIWLWALNWAQKEEWRGYEG